MNRKMIKVGGFLMGIPFVIYLLGALLIFYLKEEGAGFFVLLYSSSLVLIPSIILGFFVFLIGFFVSDSKKRKDVRSVD